MDRSLHPAFAATLTAIDKASGIWRKKEEKLEGDGSKENLPGPKLAGFRCWSTTYYRPKRPLRPSLRLREPETLYLSIGVSTWERMTGSSLTMGIRTRVGERRGREESRTGLAWGNENQVLRAWQNLRRNAPKLDHGAGLVAPLRTALIDSLFCERPVFVVCR